MTYFSEWGGGGCPEQEPDTDYTGGMGAQQGLFGNHPEKLPTSVPATLKPVPDTC